MVMKGHSTFLKAPELDSHHQIHLNVIFRIFAGWGRLTPQQRDNRCIILTQPAGLIFISKVGDLHVFHVLLHFTIDPYLIMLSVKQGSIKYHFLSLWNDSTWDGTPVSRAIGEYSNYYDIYIYIYIMRILVMS